MERILVIEDELPMRTALEDVLQGEGYRVLTAAEGQTGLERAIHEQPDLILLDIMMPRLDGFAVCRELRRLSNPVPVLMLTAKGQVEDRVTGLDAGADDYLVKPFSTEELLARVRALLRRGQPSPERLQVGDLVLDCTRRKVLRGAESIELAPKEFGILEYMMRNKGRPLSRTMIVEHVWDMDYDGLTNIVDVYIRHLRSKIDDRYPVKLIHTVRGIGYMIEAAEKAALNRTGAEAPFEA